MTYFCHQCGSALENRDTFCSECGAPVKTHEELPPKPLFTQFFTPIRPSPPLATGSVAIGLAVLGCLVIGLAIWNGLNDEPQTPAPIIKGPKYNEIAKPTLADQQAIPTAVPNLELPAKIGETFATGYWAYTVHGAEWQSAIPTFGSADFPDAAFLIVDLSACNRDRTASTLPPFKLVDKQGDEYSESSKGSFMRGRFDTLKTMNPGVYSRGYVIFDVPHRDDYRLRVSGGYESEKYRLVDLIPALRSPQDGGISDGREKSTY